MTVVYLATETLSDVWNKTFDANDLPLRLVVYLVTSLIIGVIGWRECERAYRRFLNAPQPQQPLPTREA